MFQKCKMNSWGFKEDSSCDSQQFIELDLEDRCPTRSAKRTEKFQILCAGLPRITLVCAAIICMHIVFVYTINNNSEAMEGLIKQQATIAAPRVHGDGLLSRSKRHILSSQEGEDVNSDAAAEARISQQKSSHQSQSEEHLTANTPVEQRSPTDSKTCRSGHIQGISSAVCEAVPCLPQLQRFDQTQHILSSSDSLGSEALRKINNMIGELDGVHYSLLPLLTRMQWENGVYGTLGEFGVSFGKFTSLLRHNFDPESGEKIFVSDSFNQTSSSFEMPLLAGLSRLDIFRTQMKELGLEDGGETQDRRLQTLFIHNGNVENFDLNRLSEWNIPQFRLIGIAVDNDHSDTLGRLSAELKLAACLLRDGGIIVVDGIDNAESKQLVTLAITDFFAKLGQSALSPLLTAGNKLFLTTSNWRTAYSRFLTDNVQHLHVKIAETISR